MSASQATAPTIVTGAAGFIGYHVSARLLADGHEVLGIDNLDAYYDVRLKEARLERLRPCAGFAFERLDLADHDGIQALIRTCRPQAVVHLAAQAGVRHSLDHPRAYVSSNVDGFLGILEACRHAGVPHLVYGSSSSVYGVNTKVPFSERDPVDHPVSLYATTKRANELMAETYAHLFGLPSTGLRFFTIYGPWGRPDMAYFKFTRALFEGRPIELYNGGRMQRDFTYIDDAVEAIVRLLDRPPTASPEGASSEGLHRIFNVGNHAPIDLARFVAAIEAAVGRSAERRFLPMQPGDVPTTYADVGALKAAVDFAPRTSIEEGIRHFVQWYREFHDVRSQVP